MSPQTNRAFWILLAIASLMLPLSATAQEEISWTFEDTDGDGSMWLCQAPKAGTDTRGVIRVDASGYFSLDTIDNTMFDSGDHQTNESYYFLIKNSRNPGGVPIDPNCGDVFVLFDKVPLPAHLGTFYLEAGEDNVVEMYHYCDLYRAGICVEHFDPAGEDGGGCRNCESVSVVLDTISIIEDREICVPGTNPITREDWCDGFDNDCDGLVDEECGGCDPNADEVCDDIDNDCDGLVDEGVCNEGCVDEICDGIDNDCDGLVDEEASDLCQSGFVCAYAACRAVCRNWCDQSGESCQAGVCLPEEPCGDAETYCVGGELCVYGGCVSNICGNEICPYGTACFEGACQDPSCHTAGCPAGLVCVDGDCGADPCAGVSCDTASEFCRDGACVSSCAVTTCGSTDTCVDGMCIADTCNGTCAVDELCHAGQCVYNPCIDVACPGSLICVDGACEGDPCALIVCPGEQLCRSGQCVSEEQADVIDAKAAELGNLDVDSGCSCRTATRGGSLPLPLLALGLLAGGLVALSRRRKR